MNDLETVLTVENISKSYGPVKAVRDISFELHRGRILGFLGPNGAGKTTTLRMILSLIPPTSGSVKVLGCNYVDIVHPMTRVGAALDNTYFGPNRSGRDHLRVFAHPARVGRARVEELLELLGISDAASRPVRSYSLGMRQRLALATALLGDPDILILDEPANGLDPAGITWLRQFLRTVASEGKAVLVSSHLLAEMERTVDDVVLMHQGQLLYSGTRESLLSEDATVVSCRDESSAQQAAAALERGSTLTELPGNQLWVQSTLQEVAAVLGSHSGLSQQSFALGPPTLEAAFMRTTDMKKVSAG